MTLPMIQKLWLKAGRDMRKAKLRGDDRGYGQALRRRQKLMVEKLRHGL